jgi:protein-S-isoprenylcysteine O-methyltransferase Ste14
MTILMWLLFAIATAGLAYGSRAFLRAPRSHGFFRFFAAETIFLLVVVNGERWFQDPASWHQLISWGLLLISVILVVHGAWLLRTQGRPDAQRGDPALRSFEKTTALVTVGVYRYIRHPMYSSLLFLAWGIFFKAPTWLAGLLALVATLFLIATARVEEAENVRYFGAAYQDYVQTTKMFIPFLF